MRAFVFMNVCVSACVYAACSCAWGVLVNACASMHALVCFPHISLFIHFLMEHTSFLCSCLCCVGVVSDNSRVFVCFR